MDLDDKRRERWVEELLAELDLASLTSGAAPPSIPGATGPTSLELESHQGGVFDPSPAGYAFDAHNTRLDIFPGALIFHFRHTKSDSHERLQKIFERASQGSRLLIEPLWFSDTCSSQIALVRAERLQY